MVDKKNQPPIFTGRSQTPNIITLYVAVLIHHAYNTVLMKAVYPAV